MPMPPMNGSDMAEAPPEQANDQMPDKMKCPKCGYEGDAMDFEGQEGAAPPMAPKGPPDAAMATIAKMISRR